MLKIVIFCTISQKLLASRKAVYFAAHTAAV